MAKLIPISSGKKTASILAATSSSKTKIKTSQIINKAAPDAINSTPTSITPIPIPEKEAEKREAGSGKRRDREREGGDPKNNFPPRIRSRVRRKVRRRSQKKNTICGTDQGKRRGEGG